MHKKLAIIFFLLLIIKGMQGKNINNLYVKQAGRGKIVLAIHGGPGMDSGYFFPYFNGISNFARLVVYDQRGCGRSIMPAAYNANFSDYLNDIESIRKHLAGEDGKIVLLLHSFGSVLGLKYLVENPDKVEKVVVVSGLARKDPDQYKDLVLTEDLKRKISKIRLSSLPEKVKAKRIKALRFSLYFYQPVYKSERFVRHFLDTTSFNTKVYSSLIDSDEYINFDLREKLKDYKHIPFLVIVGRHDIVTQPYLSEEIVNAVKASRYVIFEQSGHFPFIEEQERFVNEVKKFIIP